MRLLPEERAVARAWEHFADGADEAPGVRPEIAASWLRSRDEFRVDPARDRALPADPSPASAPEEAVTRVGVLGVVEGISLMTETVPPKVLAT